MSLIGKLLGKKPEGPWSGDSDIVADGNLSRTALKALSKRMGLLNSAKKGLGDRAYRFVIRGEGRAILLDIEKTEGCWHALEGHEGYSITDKRDKLRKAFYENCEGVTADLMLRYAEVFLAAAKSDKQTLLHEDRPGYPDWLRVFMLELMPSRHIYSHNDKRPLAANISASLIGDMLALNDEPPDALIGIVFERAGSSWLFNNVDLLMQLPGLADFMCANADAVRTLPKKLTADGRAALATALAKLDLAVVPFTDVLIALALDGSKKARESAATSLTTAKDAAKPTLYDLLQRGGATERFHAVNMIKILYGADSSDALRAHLEQETSQKVIEAIEGALSTAAIVAQGASDAPGDTAAPAPSLEIPPYEKPDLDAKLGAEWQMLFRDLVDTTNEVIKKQNAESKKGGYHYRMDPIAGGDVGKFISILNGELALKKKGRLNLAPLLYQAPQAKLAALLNHSDVKLVHAVRFQLVTGNDSTGSCRSGHRAVGTTR